MISEFRSSIGIFIFRSFFFKGKHRGARAALAGAAKKIAGKIRRGALEKEDLVLGAEAIPNGSRFNPSGDRDAVTTPVKKPPFMVG
jgi:hypothetical protein